MKTAVVILNWNTKGFLERFLPGLLESVREEDACVIVADSASTDGSMEMMQERFPDVRRIILDRNYGFTGGYNRALAQVDAEYYVLINSDIEVTEGWLEPLTEWMDHTYGASKHIGRASGGVTCAVSLRMQLEKLRRRQKRAIADEAYEEAALLRDQIRALSAEMEAKRDE